MVDAWTQTTPRAEREKKLREAKTTAELSTPVPQRKDNVTPS